MFLGLIQPAAILWNLSDGEFDVTKHAEKGWQLFQETIEIGNSLSKRPSRDTGKGGQS
jgi:hypothetical protein